MLKVTVFGPGLVCPDLQHGQQNCLQTSVGYNQQFYLGPGLVCPDTNKIVLKATVELVNIASVKSWCWLQPTVFGSGLVSPDPQHGQLEPLPDFCWLQPTVL